MKPGATWYEPEHGLRYHGGCLEEDTDMESAPVLWDPAAAPAPGGESPRRERTLSRSQT